MGGISDRFAGLGLKAVLANIGVDTAIGNKDAAMDIGSLRTAKEVYHGSDLLGLSKPA